MNAPIYLDTSALAKLFLHEVDGPAVRDFIGQNAFTMVSSELVEVELVRAVSRIDHTLISSVRAFLKGLVLLPITTSVRTQAGELFPGRTKTFDAIHLASAFEIKSDLAGLMTYDNRMAELAREVGVETILPG